MVALILFVMMESVLAHPLRGAGLDLHESTRLALEKISWGPFSNLCLINQKLERILDEYPDPREVLLVLDLDDTLVLRGKPMLAGQYHSDWRSGGQFVERPCGLDLLNLAKKRGVHFAVSSAHPYFDDTVEKLKHLEVFREVGIPIPFVAPELKTAGLWIATQAQADGPLFEENFNFYKTGRVISAQKAQSSPQTYSEKAAAGILSLTPAERNQIKIALLVDDTLGMHHKFAADLEMLAPTQLPKLRRVGQLILSKTKDSRFEKGLLSAARKGSWIQGLYREAYARVAPVVMGAVDDCLRNALSSVREGESQFYFLARDGLGGYKIAKKLIQSFPQRYSATRLDQLHYVHLNKDTLKSPLAKSYLIESGLRSGHTAYFFDIGWGGSTTPDLKALVRDVGADFGHTCLVFSHREPTQDVRSFIRFHFDGDDHPFGQVSSNPAVHFMEDTFSGSFKRSITLSPGEKVTPNGLDRSYEGDVLVKRVTAIQALEDAVADLVQSGPAELDAIDVASAKGVLYPFLDRLKWGQTHLKQMTVPHEK